AMFTGAATPVPATLSLHDALPISHSSLLTREGWMPWLLCLLCLLPCPCWRRWPPALPLPPSSHNRMPPHPATRHQHTTPTPRQVRAGHYRCCSRRRRWGVPCVCLWATQKYSTVGSSWQWMRDVLCATEA